MKAPCILLLSALLLIDRVYASTTHSIPAGDDRTAVQGNPIRAKRSPLGKLALLGGAGLVGKKALLLGGAAVGTKALLGAGLLGAGLYKAKQHGGDHARDYRYYTPTVPAGSSWGYAAAGHGWDR